ncbi:hypothetical protein IPL68_02010 [Candidatus Saccharibacteria bacterium]|nr:MAG: hypothetical protein IPL68_02010 [Candidatus Saccharibacteria bacterium]
MDKHFLPKLNKNIKKQLVRAKVLVSKHTRLSIALAAFFSIFFLGLAIFLTNNKASTNTASGTSKLTSSKSSSLASNNDEKKNTASSTANTAPADTSKAPQGNNPSTKPTASSTKGALVASPSSITLSSTTNGATISVRSSTGDNIFSPIVSSLPGLSVYISSNYSLSGTADKQTWQISVDRMDFNSKGQDYITITDRVGRFASTRVLVTWNPAPTFNITQGSLVRSDGIDTITHTANFSIVPNNPYFGNPNMNIRLYGGPCINTSDLSRSFVYNGQNSFSIPCVVNRVATGPGTLPPLPSATTFNLDVSGTVNGQYIRGTYPVVYTLPSGYDR